MKTPLLFLTVTLLVCNGWAATLRVASPGAAASPETFASLHAALAALPGLFPEGAAEPVEIEIAPGVHYLAETVYIGEELMTHVPRGLIIRGAGVEETVLSGGTPLTGWTESDDHVWRLPLPDCGTDWTFRDLYRNGVRAPRSRYPAAPELLRVTSVSEDYRTITVNETLPVQGAFPSLELVMFQNWSVSRDLILKIDDKTLTLRNPIGWIGHGSMTCASEDKPLFIEHAMGLLDAPGEWYLDGEARVLLYRAAPDEDPNEALFVAPRLHRLVEVRGTAQTPLTNVIFRDVTFAHCNWQLPDFGYMGIQAGHHGVDMQTKTHVLPAAIEFHYARDCALEGCRVAHTGASGVAFGAGTRGNRIAGCLIEDIGGTGVMFGLRARRPEARPLPREGQYDLSEDWTTPDDIPLDNSIVDSILRRCGAVQHGAVAVFDAFCKGTHIAHNHVYDLPYTGISAGFRWNSSETSQRDCAIEYNHIHDVMLLLADGGGIYTLGYQPGTRLLGNVIYNVHRSDFAHGGAPNNGIFFDEGSKALHIEGQVIWNTSGESIRFNQTQADNMTWEGNVYNVEPGDDDFPDAALEKAGPRITVPSREGM